MMLLGLGSGSLAGLMVDSGSWTASGALCAGFGAALG